jgi:Cu/Ag efflux protein CusF
MKTLTKIRVLFVFAAGLPVAIAADAKKGGCEGCQDCPKGEAACAAATPVASTKATDAVKRHPLKGVIAAVDAGKSALMVKHEEIPGVMRAMTMQFKVDAATLKSARKGQAITGLMSRQGSDWVLEEVKFVGPKSS